MAGGVVGGIDGEIAGGIIPDINGENAGGIAGGGGGLLAVLSEGLLTGLQVESLGELLAELPVGLSDRLHVLPLHR